MGLRSYRFAVLFAALILGRLEVRALDPHKTFTQYVIQSWGMEEGLPQNMAGAICQTRDGYLWIATEEGLARFDGVRFTVFDRKTTPAMGSQRILCLLESRDGSLWIGTRGGGVLRYASGVFTRYASAEGLPDDNVSTRRGTGCRAMPSIASSRTGRMFSGSARGRGSPASATASLSPSRRVRRSSTRNSTRFWTTATAISG